MNKRLLIGLGAIGFIAVMIYIRAGTQTRPSDVSQSAPNQITTIAPTQSSQSEVSRYTPYSQEAFNQAKDKKRVLYFHANWCSTCRLLDKEISENINEIPNNVVLYKTDYDTESALKKKYAVTYQHTFVQVDAQGNEVTKWSGGATQELISNVK